MVMVLGGSGTINATSTMALSTNNADRINIDSNGNIGIGTSSPVNASNQKSLTISGTSYGRVDLQVGGSTKAFWYAGSSGMSIGPQGALYLGLETNNTERMRIDSSGYVTRPYQPMFYARHNNNSSANGRYGLFDDVLTNQGGHASHSTFGGSYSYTRFTCPIAGKYFVWVGNIGPNTSTTQRTYVHKNGSNNSAQLRTGQTNYSNHGTSASMNVIIDAAANDWIACYSSSDDGSMAFYSGEYSHMGVILIG